MRNRMRWRIAHLVDRIPGQCWADIVCWVLRSPKPRDRDWLGAIPFKPITAACRLDAAAAGRCYCGRLAADGTAPTSEGDDR